MPTRITIENQYAPLRNLPYPSIAICTPNQISITALRHFNRTLVEGNSKNINVGVAFPQLLGFYEMLGELDEKSLHEIELLIEENRYHALQVMGMIPQSCEDFLKLCFFKKKVYPNCRELFHPIITNRGLCCVFNNIYQHQYKKRNEKIKNFTQITAQNVGAGLGNALSVVVDYNPEDAVDGTVVSAGATRVMITEAFEFPSEEESNLVRPNSESYHIIHPTYTYCSEDVKRLPVGSRKCLFAEEKQVRYFGEYHSSDCSLLCHIQQIERHCHCTMIYVPHVHVERACNISSIACIIRVKSQISDLFFINNNCDCPRDCETYEYRSELVVGNMNALEHLTANFYDGLKFNDSSSIMHFFFPRPVFVQKKQETVMSLIIFFSNLGGVFGLCMGCSVISVVELIFFINMFLRSRIKRWKRRVQNHQYLN
ncbi:unnamed protein product [Leptosia nina]|uniref:Sodium channel protein Nach n=1 Tax=Leptosia nina TaxID=320188 RepID=A0AAV1JVF3_9NEOP